MKKITYNNQSYPAYQASGNATRFIIPFAREFCKGKGYDIGANNEMWVFDDAKPIDKTIKDTWHATYLPSGQVDYIYSSHTLEHINDWVYALDYWLSKIKVGGVIFLYLPHPDQEYWKPYNNRKHIHIFHPKDLAGFFKSRKCKDILYTGRDLNHSFAIVAEKTRQTDKTLKLKETWMKKNIKSIDPIFLSS